MYARIRNQICLELGEVHVQGTVESQTCRDGRHYLSNQSIQIRVSRSIDIQVSSAQLVNGLEIAGSWGKENFLYYYICDVYSSVHRGRSYKNKLVISLYLFHAGQHTRELSDDQIQISEIVISQSISSTGKLCNERPEFERFKLCRYCILNICILYIKISSWQICKLEDV